MRRFLSVSALAVLLLAAFALTDHPIAVRAASNPGNLTLDSVTRFVSGCPLGPAYMFCDQPPGTSSQGETFFVDNSAAITGVAVALGPIPGSAENFAAGDFKISSNSCTGNIGANLQCEVQVEFSPTTTGLRAAVLTVTDSQGDSLPINIEGTGSNLALSAPPGSVGPSDNSFNYGGITLNGTSGTESFTVTAGAAVTQVHFSVAAIPGLESQFASSPHYDFSETDNCSALAAGATCTATVEFTPEAVGLRSAALIATDSEGDSTTIYLSGYGVNGPGGTTESSALFFPFTQPGANSATCARENYFGFCNIPVGGISASSTFTMQNTSGAQITGLTVPKASVIAQGATAPDFTVKNTSCASVLAANASCDITVAFTPTKSGLRQGAIVITDAQGDSTAVNLAGYGDDYSIATQLPTELSVIPPGTATFNATLTPDNVFGMNGEQVTFVCPANLPANTSCVATPCPATITPGTSVSVKVTLVTSSATVVASVPTGGCSSYGPSLAKLLGAPGAKRSPLQAALGVPVRSSPLYPALLVFAALGAIGLLATGFSARIPGPRGRAALIIVSTGLAAAILAGCHHHGATITTATPTGATTLTVLGNAVDANGNSLNASRQFQVTLDVVTK